MRVDVVSLRVSVLQSVDANVHIFDISRLNMPRHARDSGRAVEFQRSRTALHSGREIEIGKAGSMVRMQVRGKNDFEILGGERRDIFVASGSSSASHHAWTKVDEIRGAIYYHGDRWARAIRVDDGRSGAENDELGVSGIRGLGEPRSSQTKKQRDGNH